MTSDEALEVVQKCARGGDVSATQLRAAIYLLERGETDSDEQPRDDWKDIYGDGDSTVTPFRRKAS